MTEVRDLAQQMRDALVKRAEEEGVEVARVLSFKYTIECTQQHDWRDTGRFGVHIEGKFGAATSVKVELCVPYVVCNTCGQSGFRLPGSRVVYTWARGS